MAQWSGQFTGNTHASRVQEAEAALQHAAAVLKAARTDEQLRKQAKAVTQLAKKLLQARVRLMKARVQEKSTEQRSQGLGSLQQRLKATQEAGITGILDEFGVASVIRVE